MNNFKQITEKWAKEVNKVLAKAPNLSHEETANQLQEFMLLGGLVYDDKGNWIPQLNSNQYFEIKSVEIKDGKIVL